MSVRATKDAVRLARERLGLNQTAFGQLLGVRQATVSDWESGRSVPLLSLERMQEIIQEREGGVRPDLMVDPRAYVLAVFDRIEGDARSTLDKIAEARRVLGASPPGGDGESTT